MGCYFRSKPKTYSWGPKYTNTSIGCYILQPHAGKEPIAARGTFPTYCRNRGRLGKAAVHRLARCRWKAGEVATAAPSWEAGRGSHPSHRRGRPGEAATHRAAVETQARQQPVTPPRKAEQGRWRGEKPRVIILAPKPPKSGRLITGRANEGPTPTTSRPNPASLLFGQRPGLHPQGHLRLRWPPQLPWQAAPPRMT
jgi:hypothetical protein